MRFLYTPGEPAGIGPDLIIQLAQQVLPAALVVVADPQLLEERAQQLHLPLQIQLFDSKKLKSPEKSQLTVMPVKLRHSVRPGQLNAANAEYVIKTLTLATQLCVEKKFSAVITGPVHKGIINEAGIPFSGHTEFFAQLTQTKKVVMMLVADKLRVALVTTHLPLRAVADVITPQLLRETLWVLQRGLQEYFAIKNPKILVAGLNPHAGEGGHLGHEEIDIIVPVLDQLCEEGMDLLGPLPADTLFTPFYLGKADAVLTMYHDQGLPVLKFAGFGHTVNVSLGLPFVRTSVDHGTALELAGTGRAEVGSLRAAVVLAVELGAKT